MEQRLRMNAPYVKSNKWSEAMAILASPTVSSISTVPWCSDTFPVLAFDGQISSSVFHYFSAFYFSLFFKVLTEQACFKPAAIFSIASAVPVPVLFSLGSHLVRSQDFSQLN